ncbi:MAG: cation diffusion facilitator family transporter [Eggerthellaceae bacterium]|nr:cation diffusion facilitator family transporter [Eggerthellaceae bacterium]
MIQWMLNHFVPDNADTKNPKVRTRIGAFAGAVGIVCNVILCAAKILIGAVAGSVSIIADGVNNLSDAASNIISLFGFKLAGKPADRDHPYGHGRFEYLSGLIVAVLILVIGVELLKSSVEKIVTPEPVEFSWVLVIVLLIAIVVKLWMMAFNNKLGKLINSQTLIATAADSRNDVISTSAVLIAALISHFTGYELDAWMGLAVALFILWSGIGLVRDTIDPLLGGPADPEVVEHIEKKIMEHEGVLGIHDLMVHDYGPGRLFASVHAEVPAEVPVLQSHEIIDDIEEEFLRDDGMEVIIHLDPIVTSDPVAQAFRAWIADNIKTIDPHLTVHDVRMVPGEGHTNVLFDCVKPFELDMTPEELALRIQALVREYNPSYNTIVKVDLAYTALPEN